MKKILFLSIVLVMFGASLEARTRRKTPALDAAASALEEHRQEVKNRSEARRAFIVFLRTMLQTPTPASPVLDGFLLSMIKALEPVPFKFKTYTKYNTYTK